MCRWIWARTSSAVDCSNTMTTSSREQVGVLLRARRPDRTLFSQAQTEARHSSLVGTRVSPSWQYTLSEIRVIYDGHRNSSFPRSISNHYVKSMRIVPAAKSPIRCTSRKMFTSDCRLVRDQGCAFMDCLLTFQRQFIWFLFTNRLHSFISRLLFLSLEFLFNSDDFRNGIDHYSSRLRIDESKREPWCSYSIFENKSMDLVIGN